MRPQGPSYSRRRFVQGGLALAGVGLLAGCGIPIRQPEQKPRVHRIGLLSPSQVSAWSSSPIWEAFRQELRDLGYVQGQNLIIEHRWAEERPERLPELAAELVRLDIELIVANSSAALAPALQASSTVPVVMAVYGGDPVRDGVVASLARPGENVTGVTNFATRLAAKRLELLKETAPTTERVAVLWDPTSPGGAPQLAELQAAAPALGMQVHSLAVPDGTAIRGAFESAISGRADALLVAPSPLLTRYATTIAEFTVTNRLPAIGYDWTLAEAGLLLVYGPDLKDLFRRAATYVDKILKGARPAELPVEQPTKFEFVINLRTAQALGLTIPQSVLLQATEVIQ